VASWLEKKVVAHSSSFDCEVVGDRSYAASLLAEDRLDSSVPAAAKPVVAKPAVAERHLAMQNAETEGGILIRHCLLLMIWIAKMRTIASFRR